MFSLADVPSSFDWPVIVRFPKHGAFVEKRFTAQFALLPQEEVEDILRQVKEQAEDNLISADLLEQIWVGWNDDVTDETGQPLPVTEANRRVLRQIIPVRNAVMQAWLEAMAGKKAARKN